MHCPHCSGVFRTNSRKDGLYSKITGGQRVDLCGAHKADLPSIWAELIEAGGESGHGYGRNIMVLILSFSILTLIIQVKRFAR